MSMGGMIAQTVAARHRARVGSLTSIMSTTGAARVGRPAWSTWRLMLGRPARTRDEHIDRAVRMYRHIRSAAYPFDESAVRATAARTWDRDPAPAAGVGRQLAGILKSGDRTGELRAVTAPTLVVHGDRDLMVTPTGATATARAIPGARLRTLAGRVELHAAVEQRLVRLFEFAAEIIRALSAIQVVADHDRELERKDPVDLRDPGCDRPLLAAASAAVADHEETDRSVLVREL
jgi:pimeloyl-ACP methyl ester carboxylesterase